MEKYNTDSTEAEFNFQYPNPNDPILSKLRNIAALTISTNASALEKVENIAGYVHSLFTHNGDNQPLSSDPITIINEKLFRARSFAV